VASPERNLDDHIQLLQRQEFIFEKTILPDLEYMFRHALTKDVVYEGLPESRRRAFHERVAEAIAQLGILVQDEKLPLLATHYQKTANHAKALEYALAAGERARHLYANREAAVRFREALDLLEQQPTEDKAQKLQVLETLGDVHTMLADFEAAEQYYARAVEESASPSLRARLLRKRGDLCQARGRYAQARTHYRAAEKALEEVDDAAEQLHLWLALAHMERSRGALEPASAACLRALSIADRVDSASTAHLYLELGEIERERGRLGTAAGYLEAASGLWEQIGALEKQALVATALADISFNRGDLSEALRHLEKARDVQQRVLDRQGLATTLYAMGRVRSAMGELAVAIDHYTKAVAIATEIDDRLLAANCMLQLGIAHLDRGEVERAQRHVARAYDEYKKIRNWRGAAHALVARARVLRVTGERDQAQSSLLRAAKLADEMDDPWLRGQIAILDAEIEEGSGRLDRAEERVTTGITMARDLSDARLAARGERILGRIRAQQSRSKEALSLLLNSAETLRRSGAQIDAARTALDFVIAAQAAPEDSAQTVEEMLHFALATFDRTGSSRDLQTARSIAQRLHSAGSVSA
jgi:tetratricopeptide (TPR) repeat protein